MYEDWDDGYEPPDSATYAGVDSELPPIIFPDVKTPMADLNEQMRAAAPPVADADTYAWLSAEAKRLGFKTVYAAIMAASESRRLNGEKK